MATPVLEARSVSKSFGGEFSALMNCSLAVHRGETLAIVGESGSGKTSLLKLFNRLLEPSSGSIWIDGQPATDHDPIRLRRMMGYVQQQGGLIPHWNVKRNVELVPRLLGWSPEKNSQQCQKMLEWVGLSPEVFMDRYPNQLSGGQQQRVALARSLAAEPPILLLDEPFGALDGITRRQVQKEFLKLQGQLKKTVILVTHDLDEARRLSQRLAVIRAGQIQQIGSFEELIAKPVSSYITRLLQSGEAH